MSTIRDLTRPKWYRDALSKVERAIAACPAHQLYPLKADGRITAYKCKDCPYRKVATS